MKESNSPFTPFNSWKALVHGKQFEGIVDEDYYPPVVVNLDVTGKCQYNCLHCHHRIKQIGGRDMPDLDERLARTFPAFCKNWQRDGIGVRACCIVGSRGDALLYPGLPKLLKDLHFNGIEVGLVTNGYGWTDELVEYAAYYCKFVGVSVDAGDKKGYDAVHRCPPDAWIRIQHYLKQLVRTVNKHSLRNDIGFKFLIFPESCHALYKACQIAKDIGVRYVQIRPADLPEEERAKIDIDDVNRQIAQAMEELDEPGVFEIVGIRHKFTPDMKKILPAYCYMTALTVTITSDGKVWPCVDRRWDEETLLADCMEGGWTALKDVWGTAKHIQIVHDVINRGGKGPGCNIRCSNYGTSPLFDNIFVDDRMDRNLI